MDATMKNSSAVIEQLLQSTHEEALARNEAQEEKWRAYSAENEDLCSRLLTLRDKLKHDVMVPVGRKALFRGQLVHTNEIMVCLGDGWFVKKSAAEAVDVCRRKMKECDEMLERLRKERELLESRKTFPIQNDVFGGRDEIIEPFNEEEESKWREKHKESLKRYRRDLKAERERRKEEEARSRDSNKDLFKILDGLECQEENDDELNKLVEDEDRQGLLRSM
ncbi:unconventional prefoldin RPB5 interactor-like protein [Nilaparvata lugens]|uniref:unconventional prefoldin RPB5 interactor-like protein n=1 Tax=Nilaparvata lugens TaxID=108931 RepID=UPI00193E4997|nr:unconventional prefoldin RPB5 interactor-like protein [Nilaparvata lugens]